MNYFYLLKDKSILLFEIKLNSNYFIFYNNIITISLIYKISILKI